MPSNAGFIGQSPLYPVVGPDAGFTEGYVPNPVGGYGFPLPVLAGEVPLDIHVHAQITRFSTAFCLLNHGSNWPNLSSQIQNMYSDGGSGRFWMSPMNEGQAAYHTAG